MTSARRRHRGLRAWVAVAGLVAVGGKAPPSAAESDRQLGALAEQYRGEEREGAVSQLGLWTRGELEAATQILVETVEAGYIRLLRRAAETTGGAYWPVASATTRLSEAFLRILEASNARYILRYEPTGVEPTGRHRLKVSVRRRGVEVRARREYVVAPAAAP